MKKIVAFIAFSIWLIPFVSGQMFQGGEIRFGIQVSPNWGWMVTDDNTINKNGETFGLKLGVLGEYYFRERYALMSGIGFAFNHGGILHYDNSGPWWNRSEKNGIDTLLVHSDLEYHIQYVEIPLGLKLKTKDFGHMRIYMEIPIFTLGINTQARGTIEDIDVDKTDIKREVNALVISWGINAGLEYNVTASTVLVAGLGYQQYFTDITDDNSVDRSKAKMHNITLRLGIYF